MKHLCSVVLVVERHQDAGLQNGVYTGGNTENGYQLKTVHGHARTMKLALEARVSEKVAETSDLIPWLIRHAAMLMNIGQRGDDGRTASERVKGRTFNREVPEFGESVLYLKPSSLGKDKLDSRW